MSLEGSFRDLALPEVCQLLAHTRKSGELHLKAPLAGLSACILFESGAIVGAELCGLAPAAQLTVSSSAPDAAESVERATLELLCWSEGEFRFVPLPNDSAVLRTGVRLQTELLLIEGARRCEEWERLRDRIPNTRAVPAFADVEPRQLPLLHLQPQQWEVLTGVDGQRDLTALARSLGRDLLEVARVVHGLIGTGLLKLADISRVQRAQATPPSSSAQRDDTDAGLWVPNVQASPGDDTSDADQHADIFDPVRVGVVTADELPSSRTPLRVGAVNARRSPMAESPRVSLSTAELRDRGNAAVKRGDFAESLRQWSAIVEYGDTSDWSGSNDANAHRVYALEAIAVVTKLQALLNTKVQRVN